MTGFLGDTLDTCPPNDKDKNVLHLIFGDKTCRDDLLTKFLWYFGLAILLTIFFFLLTCRPVRKFMDKHVDNPTICSGIIIAIFFIIVLIVDWIIISWRCNTPLCGRDPCDC